MNQPWTPEQAAFAANLYHEGHTINSIAVALVRTERSVIAKFTQLGIYRATPKPPREPTKAELVGELAQILNVDPDRIHTLTAASREALVTVIKALAG
jgi:hypothetical protein